MTIKTTLPVMMAISLVLVAGCKKDEPAPSAGPDQSGATAIGAAPTASAAAGAVATYPDMVTQSGTKQLLQPFTVYQAADTASPVLAHVSVGQWINLKGSHANWMLIDWPSGVGQMSPGWIELRGGASDSRLAQSPPVPTTPVVVDAGAPAPTDAGTGPIIVQPDAGKRPAIIIKPRH